MKIYHVYTLDIDSDAHRTVTITTDWNYAMNMQRFTPGACIDIWKNAVRIDWKQALKNTTIESEGGKLE